MHTCQMHMSNGLTASCTSLLLLRAGLPPAIKPIWRVRAAIHGHVKYEDTETCTKITRAYLLDVAGSRSGASSSGAGSTLSVGETAGGGAAAEAGAPYLCTYLPAFGALSGPAAAPPAAPQALPLRRTSRRNSPPGAGRRPPVCQVMTMLGPSTCEFCQLQLASTHVRWPLELRLHRLAMLRLLSVGSSQSFDHPPPPGVALPLLGFGRCPMHRHVFFRFTSARYVPSLR